MEAHAPLVAETASSEDVHSGRKPEDFWFPGRWVGGIALIAGPLVLLTGVLLRIPFHFFFPQQLAAYQEHPTLMFAAYSCFLAGNILLWPGIITLARMIGASKPGWALWGGTLVIFGLFARTFHAGVDHLAFQLVQVQSLDLATQAVADAYGALRIVDTTLTTAIINVWSVLALGAYRSGTLGLLRSVALGLMTALMIGVLKGSTLVSVVATAGLCIALVPLGLQVLRDGSTPQRRTIVRWTLLMVGLMGAFYFLGQAG